ncbi:MAG: RDD family protein, partial [Balneolales bacterium]|nr:RDD family protein [Balneolales bacterium]
MAEQEYAGFWIRFSASFIDLVISVVVLMIPLSYIYGAQYWTAELWVYGVWDLILGYIVPFVATLWFWHRFLATPGKMATNLIVVDARTGNKL